MQLINFWKLVFSQSKDTNYPKKEVRKLSILQIKKIPMANSKVPTHCSLIEQQRKSHCGVAANDADSV